MSALTTATSDAAPAALSIWLGAIASAAVWLGLSSLASPHVPAGPMAAYAFAFASVSASALAVAAAAPASRWALGLCLPAAGTLLALHAEGVTGLLGAVAVLGCLLVAGTAVGAAVGARIEHPGHLLFVAPVSALADVVSVHHPNGVSAAILADEAALSVLALPFVMLGSDVIAPVLGVGDVVFLALYASVARTHGLSRFRTLAALALALLATALVVVTIEAPVPALPFLGAAMLLAHPAARRPRQQDRRAGLAGLGLIALAAVWLLFLRR